MTLLSFGATNTNCLSVLQAVAQGYRPITQEDTEQEICEGNQSTKTDTKL